MSFSGPGRHQALWMIPTNPREILSQIGRWLPSGRRSSVAEHWRLKPEALGSIPGGATFPFKTLPFKGLRTVRPRLCL